MVLAFFLVLVTFVLSQDLSLLKLDFCFDGINMLIEKQMTRALGAMMHFVSWHRSLTQDARFFENSHMDKCLARHHFDGA